MQITAWFQLEVVSGGHFVHHQCNGRATYSPGTSYICIFYLWNDELLHNNAYFPLVIVTRQGAVLDLLGNNQLPGLKNKYYILLGLHGRLQNWQTTIPRSIKFSSYHNFKIQRMFLVKPIPTLSARNKSRLNFLHYLCPTSCNIS